MAFVTKSAIGFVKSIHPIGTMSTNPGVHSPLGKGIGGRPWAMFTWLMGGWSITYDEKWDHTIYCSADKEIFHSINVNGAPSLVETAIFLNYVYMHSVI